ncbi:receptor expression-enhancing protein 4 [Heteronotia binoei]|uniref:receptor expression-enhancing protein 4 n=1 Tax=Heteronotia binoei TaxID=13085 RepID=UPI002931E7FC|nr:receptor expression-enhancing protein 4 [Heteronotia binoei]
MAAWLPSLHSWSCHQLCNKQAFVWEGEGLRKISLSLGVDSCVWPCVGAAWSAGSGTSSQDSREDREPVKLGLAMASPPAAGQKEAPPSGATMILEAAKAKLLRWSQRGCLWLLAGLYRWWPACLTPPFRYRLLFGMLYPAYASYKAVKTKNIREYVRWMMYWIVFALFMATETVADTFISWFPFYYEIKMAFVVWLLSPYTRGASLLYRKFIHPTLSNKEKEIDQFIVKAKERGYETLVSLGKRSLNVAATAAVQAATKSQGALAGRLRSFSMQDLTSIPDTSPVHFSDPLYPEEQQRPRLATRTVSHRTTTRQLEYESNEEDCWSDSQLSPGSKAHNKDPLISRPLSRTQSLRLVKKKPSAKEGSTRLVRSRLRKKVVEQDS